MAAQLEGAEVEGSGVAAVEKEAVVGWVIEQLDSAAGTTTPWSPARRCSGFDTACSVLAPLAVPGTSKNLSPHRST